MPCCRGGALGSSGRFLSDGLGVLASGRHWRRHESCGSRLPLARARRCLRLRCCAPAVAIEKPGLAAELRTVSAKGSGLTMSRKSVRAARAQRALSARVGQPPRSAFPAGAACLIGRRSSGSSRRRPRPRRRRRSSSLQGPQIEPGSWAESVVWGSDLHPQLGRATEGVVRRGRQQRLACLLKQAS